VKILGIDPGSTITGYGVVTYERGRFGLVTAGALRLASAGPLPRRLLAAADGIRTIIEEHRPDEVCLENIFQHVNVRSALVLGHVRGALMLELARGALPVHEYTALQVKKALVGHGHAAKEQVRAMVLRLLATPTLAGPHDVSDALAVAICHAHSIGGLRRRGLA